MGVYYGTPENFLGYYCNIKDCDSGVIAELSTFSNLPWSVTLYNPNHQLIGNTNYIGIKQGTSGEGVFVFSAQQVNMSSLPSKAPSGVYISFGTASGWRHYYTWNYMYSDGTTSGDSDNCTLYFNESRPASATSAQWAAIEDVLNDGWEGTFWKNPVLTSTTLQSGTKIISSQYDYYNVEPQFGLSTSNSVEPTEWVYSSSADSLKAPSVSETTTYYLWMRGYSLIYSSTIQLPAFVLNTLTINPAPAGSKAFINGHQYSIKVYDGSAWHNVTLFKST